MGAEKIIQLMDKHCITVRQIPRELVSVFEIQHMKKGDEIIETKNGIKRCKRRTIPKNAGYWMAKQIDHTFSTVRWDKKDNLSPTLEEAVLKAVENLKKE